MQVNKEKLLINSFTLFTRFCGSMLFQSLLEIKIWNRKSSSLNWFIYQSSHEPVDPKFGLRKQNKTKFPYSIKPVRWSRFSQYTVKIYLNNREKSCFYSENYSKTINNEYIERIHQISYSLLSDIKMLQIFSFLIKWLYGTL